MWCLKMEIKNSKIKKYIEKKNNYMYYFNIETIQRKSVCTLIDEPINTATPTNSSKPTTIPSNQVTGDGTKALRMFYNL